MKTVQFVFLIMMPLLFACSSKNTKLEKYAIEWSNNIEKKAIENSSQTPDSVTDRTLHDTIRMVVALKDGQIIKSIQINRISNDTLTEIYWGHDLRFVFARRYCPMLHGEADEIIAYEGQPIGLHKFFYCNGKIKMQGLEYKGRVGIWTMFDTSGKVLKKTDYGNLEKLSKLKEMKYNG